MNRTKYSIRRQTDKTEQIQQWKCYITLRNTISIELTSTKKKNLLERVFSNEISGVRMSEMAELPEFSSIKRNIVSFPFFLFSFSFCSAIFFVRCRMPTHDHPAVGKNCCRWQIVHGALNQSEKYKKITHTNTEWENEYGLHALARSERYDSCIVACVHTCAMLDSAVAQCHRSSPQRSTETRVTICYGHSCVFRCGDGNDTYEKAFSNWSGHVCVLRVRRDMVNEANDSVDNVLILFFCHLFSSTNLTALERLHCERHLRRITIAAPIHSRTRITNTSTARFYCVFAFGAEYLFYQKRLLAVKASSRYDFVATAIAGIELTKHNSGSVHLELHRGTVLLSFAYELTRAKRNFPFFSLAERISRRANWWFSCLCYYFKWVFPMTAFNFILFSDNLANPQTIQFKAQSHYPGWIAFWISYSIHSFIHIRLDMFLV